MSDDINHFSYSERDYLSLRDQLVQYLRTRIPDWVPGDPTDGTEGNPSDFATVFVEMSAYIGDLMSYYVDRAAQEATPWSAASSNNVLAWAELFGFTPALARSARTQVVFDIEGSDPIEIPHRLRLKSTTGKTFEVMLPPDETTNVVPESVTLVPNWEQQKRTLEVWEGQSVYTSGLRGVELGVSDGSARQKYKLPHLNIDSADMWVSVYLDDPVSSEPWFFTYRLTDSLPDERVFTVRLDKDRQYWAIFGDGFNGAVPPKGYTMRIYYRLTSGAEANNPSVVPPFSITGFEGTAIKDVTLYNPESPAGGIDPDDVETIRRKTIQVAGAQRRAVTESDYVAMALLHDEVLHADCTAKVWSRPSVWVLPKARTVYTSATERDRIIQSVERTLSALSMVGADPDVHLGMPTPLNLSLKVYAHANVRQSAVKAAVLNALIKEFAYEHMEFRRRISSEDVFNAIYSHVSNKLVRFVVPKLTPVYPNQPTENDPTDTDDVLMHQRFAPRTGELLYIDTDTLDITIYGGIKDVE